MDGLLKENSCLPSCFAVFLAILDRLLWPQEVVPWRTRLIWHERGWIEIHPFWDSRRETAGAAYRVISQPAPESRCVPIWDTETEGSVHVTGLLARYPLDHLLNPKTHFNPRSRYCQRCRTAPAGRPHTHTQKSPKRQSYWCPQPDKLGNLLGINPDVQSDHVDGTSDLTAASSGIARSIRT
jgi:hypothetical protein